MPTFFVYPDHAPMTKSSATAKPAAEVEVVNEGPLLVEVVQPAPFDPVLNPDGKLPAGMVTKGEGATLAPTTTEADDMVTAGQRHINFIWESSQSIISIAITGAVIYCQINSINSETLNNAFFFVVATYLQRTNHVRIGGVGTKPYEGR